MSLTGQHDFRAHYFKRPTNCDVCSALLVGLFDKQGVRCAGCRMSCHSGASCLDVAALRPCPAAVHFGSSSIPPPPSSSPTTPPSSSSTPPVLGRTTKRAHDFKLSSFLVPTYCGACKGILAGIANQGLRCSTCSVTCHRGEGANGVANCQADLLLQGCCGRPSNKPVSGDYCFGDLTRQIAADLRSIVREGVMTATTQDNVVVPVIADLSAKAAALEFRFGGRSRSLAREVLAVQLCTLFGMYALSFVMTLLHAQRLSLDALRLASFAGSSSAFVLIVIEEAVIALAFMLATIGANNADIWHSFAKCILKIDLFTMNVDVFAAANWVKQLLVPIMWANLFFFGVAYSNWASGVRGLIARTEGGE